MTPEDTPVLPPKIRRLSVCNCRDSQSPEWPTTGWVTKSYLKCSDFASSEYLALTLLSSLLREETITSCGCCSSGLGWTSCLESPSSALILSSTADRQPHAEHREPTEPEDAGQIISSHLHNKGMSTLFWDETQARKLKGHQAENRGRAWPLSYTTCCRKVLNELTYPVKGTQRKPTELRANPQAPQTPPDLWWWEFALQVSLLLTSPLPFQVTSSRQDTCQLSPDGRLFRKGSPIPKQFTVASPQALAQDPVHTAGLTQSIWSGSGREEIESCLQKALSLRKKSSITVLLI